MPTPTLISFWFGGDTGISNIVDLTAVTAVVGIVMPTDWTPAVVTVQASPDGQNFYTMYEGRNRTLMSFQVPPNMYIAISPNQMRGLKALRLVSGTIDAPIPQGTPREFFLVVETSTTARRGEEDD